MRRGTKIIYQNDETDCGAACLSTVCEYYGKSIDLNSVRKLTKSDKHGVSMFNLYCAAQILGFDAEGLSGSIKDLIESDISIPCIAHILVDGRLEHFVVIQSICADGTGENGSGKSTIAKLLLDYYEPNAGVISIGNTSVEEIPLKQLRQMISFAPQNPFVFRGSVIDNIVFGSPEYDKNSAIAYIEKTPLNSIFSKLPNGYDSIVSESGGNLSGGQRQAISIARTLLKKSDIIVLDEATSAIDEDVASRVLDYIMEEYKDRTVISISHQNAHEKKFSTKISLKNSE